MSSATSTTDPKLTVFLAGIARRTKRRDLFELFASQYKSVVKLTLAKQRQKSSMNRGYGFLILSDAAEVRAILQKRRFTIDGREFQAKEVKTGEDLRKSREDLNSRRLFLRLESSAKSLDSLKNEDLRAFFEARAEIENAYVIDTKNLNQKRNTRKKAQEPNEKKSAYGCLILRHNKDVARMLSDFASFELMGVRIQVQEFDLVKHQVAEDDKRNQWPKKKGKGGKGKERGHKCSKEPNCNQRRFEASERMERGMEWAGSVDMRSRDHNMGLGETEDSLNGYGSFNQFGAGSMEKSSPRTQITSDQTVSYPHHPHERHQEYLNNQINKKSTTANFYHFERNDGRIHHNSHNYQHLDDYGDDMRSRHQKNEKGNLPKSNKIQPNQEQKLHKTSQRRDKYPQLNQAERFQGYRDFEKRNQATRGNHKSQATQTNIWLHSKNRRFFLDENKHTKTKNHQARVSRDLYEHARQPDSWPLEESFLDITTLNSHSPAGFYQYHQEGDHYPGHSTPLDLDNESYPTWRNLPSKGGHETSRGLKNNKNSEINNKNRRRKNKKSKKKQLDKNNYKNNNNPLFNFFNAEVIHKGYVRLHSKPTQNQLFSQDGLNRGDFYRSEFDFGRLGPELAFRRGEAANPHTLGSESTLEEIKELASTSYINENHFRENLVFNVRRLPETLHKDTNAGKNPKKFQF